MKLIAGPFSYILVFMLLTAPVYADNDAPTPVKVLNISTVAWNTVVEDYKEFYSVNRLKRMGIAFTAGGVIANTHTDAMFQKWYQTDVRSGTTDDIAAINKNFGEYRYVLPATLAAALFDNMMKGTEYNNTIGRWGKRTMRAYLLGTPLLWVTQNVTGASRPAANRGSDWRPFKDSHGVSGHSFVGAVPFLVMAGMADENMVLKTFFYAASTAAAVSRINDNAHYLSQAALGWYLAWESTDAVLDRERREKSYAVQPMMLKDGYGVNVSMRW